MIRLNWLKIMKRILLITLLLITFVVSGCNNTSKVIVEYKEDYGDINPGGVTYKFTGSSEHFGFETGKVFYGSNDERYFLFKNFKIINQIDNIDDITTYKINLKFDGKSMFTNEMEHVTDKNFNEIISDIKFEENGKYNSDGFGELDAFTITTKENFKDYVELEIKYCYSNGKCVTESLEFNYIEDH